METKKDTGVDDVDNMEIFKVHLTLTCRLYLLQQTQFLGKPGKRSIEFSLAEWDLGRSCACICITFLKENETYETQ